MCSWVLRDQLGKTFCPPQISGLPCCKLYLDKHFSRYSSAAMDHYLLHGPVRYGQHRAPGLRPSQLMLNTRCSSNKCFRKSCSGELGSRDLILKDLPAEVAFLPIPRKKKFSLSCVSVVQSPLPGCSRSTVHAQCTLPECWQEQHFQVNAIKKI